MDILDHSSRKYGMGSKMGIDATRRQQAAREIRLIPPEPTSLLSGFSELTSVNTSLFDQGFPAVIAGILKVEADHLRQRCEALAGSGLLGSTRYVLLMDPEAAGLDLRAMVWLAANNIDPLRDCFIPSRGQDRQAVLFIDATRKIAGKDDFTREWPNVIVMDEDTIRGIDEKWERFGLGDLLPSPSHRFRRLVSGPGATASKNERSSL